MSGSNGKYRKFLEKKRQVGSDSGFEPVVMPDCLFDFQRSLSEWIVRKGRGAVFADCGLGKTLIELVFAENVVRKIGGRVLIFTPLAVAEQFVAEGEKFGIECVRSRHGELPKGAKILVSNYEQMHRFDPGDFSGMVGDESSRAKHFGSKTRADLTEFARLLPYRMLATATAAPNDYFELGTSSEILGYLGFQDMMSKFFKEDTSKEFLGWGRKTYRFKGHAEKPFWRWVCSWARACRKPSDLGFDDGRFMLPELREIEHVVPYSRPHPGRFFSRPAKDNREQMAERRATIRPRCEKAAELAMNHEGASVIWCHLNDEADLVEKMIPEARQVSGSMNDDLKEEHLLAFQRGELPVLVTKPKIGCFGLNWQHCNNVITFTSHSWEQYYQSVRRCWRFGQENPVSVHIISSQGDQRVLHNLKRKARQSSRMFDELVANMNEARSLYNIREFVEAVRVPSWLKG